MATNAKSDGEHGEQARKPTNGIIDNLKRVPWKEIGYGIGAIVLIPIALAGAFLGGGENKKDED